VQLTVCVATTCMCCRLPKSVKRRLKALKRLQAEANKVESRFYEEVHEIERKYMAQYEPFFQRVRAFYLHIMSAFTDIGGFCLMRNIVSVASLGLLFRRQTGQVKKPMGWFE